MKQERSGISLLLGLLLLLSTCIGMLYASDESILLQRAEHILPKKIGLPVPVRDDKVPELLASQDGLASTQFQKTMNMIMPLAESESVEKIVEIVQGAPHKISLRIMQTLIDNRILSRDNLIQVLLGIVLQHANTKEDVYPFFDLLLKNPLFHQGAPILYVAATSSFPQSIPLLLSWIEAHAADAPWLNNAQDSALKYAVMHDKLNVLQVLQDKGVVITPAQATQLLWLVVEGKKNVHNAKFLIKNGADISYSHEGHPFLVQAVKNLDFPMIRFLISAGVNINAVADNAVGSALQTIIEMEYKATDAKSGDIQKMIGIEDYLRKHGAEENILLWKRGR